ncbi:GTPase [uncultured Campylobacter sp.]|uniref:YcjF family protein n=1 Tax=uncultured Campylobacter sp. TaxID=218934 RepID=UPI0028ECBF5B|nr:GTPase [uncultured Campylobacter sp.]
MEAAKNQQEIQLGLNDLINQAKEAFKKGMQDINSKLNVLIVGKTGVGKSTLINAVFGDAVTKTGSGKPITQEINEIKVNPNFSIYDTKGLELKGFDATCDDIANFLEENSKKRADEQIHIVWFCVAEPGRRIEEGEKRLFDIIREKDYATIVVITKAQQDKDENKEKFSDKVKGEFGVNDEYMQRVMALEIEDDDGNIKPLRGIDDLIKKTYDALPEASKQAFAREQKYNKDVKYEAALDIINKYSVAAGAIAATPIPFSDIALLLPTQIAMISHITYNYGFEASAENIAKLAASFAAVAAGGFAVRFVAGNLLKFIPAVGSIAGGAFNATVASSTTKLMGNAYLAYLNDNFELIYKGDFDLFSNLTDTIIRAYVEKLK